MRDGGSKTATDNKSYDDTFYRSIGEHSSTVSFPPERQILQRKLELSRERSPLLPGESLPRPCEEAIYHSWNPPSSTPHQFNHRGPPARLLAPLNTIHLLYPHPFAPLVPVHAEDDLLSAINFISTWHFLVDAFASA